MDTKDLLQRVRRIEIKTRGLSRQIFAGEYHSAFKGRGIAFSEVREYQYGDDIRSIDWNVTARFNHPYIKVFEEERELTVMILADMSGSGFYGTRNRQKQNLATEIAAVLSFSALQNNDKVGLILFTDKVERFIPPQKGRKQILRIIRELLDFKPERHSTDLAEPLRYLTNALKKRCTAFLLSDFMAPDFTDPLRIASSKHDLVALQIYDHRETEIPDAGFVQLQDAETGRVQWVDTSSRKVRDKYKIWWHRHFMNARNILRKSGVDFVPIATDEDYVKPLISLFKRR